MIIQSLYTYLFEKDRRFYLYNSKNSLFAEISEDLYIALFNRDYGSIPDEIITDLKNKEVVCDDKDLYTYYQSQLVKFNANCYNRSEIGLIIVPTTGCNFECKYCFEGDKMMSRMSSEVQEKIVSYLNGNKDADTINLTWYGGEPLIAFDIIENLYNRFTQIQDKTIKSHSIVTNGYPITDKVIEFINYAKVNSIQITLDGTKENHDKSRYIKAAKSPTFDIIIRNIGRVLEKCPDTKVNLRINIDRHNLNDFIVVFKELTNIFDSRNLYIYPGFIRIDTPDHCSLCYDSLSRSKAFEFFKSLRNEGIAIDIIPKEIRSRGCVMQQMNSFIIGPGGELYKCWNDVNHNERVIGHIGSNKIENQGLYFHMMSETSAFSDDNCKDCLHFPVCSGGCGWYRSMNIKKNAKYDLCLIQKDNNILEEALLLSLSNDKILYKQHLPML